MFLITTIVRHHSTLSSLTLVVLRPPQSLLAVEIDADASALASPLHAGAKS